MPIYWPGNCLNLIGSQVSAIWINRSRGSEKMLIIKIKERLTVKCSKNMLSFQDKGDSMLLLDTLSLPSERLQC